MRQAADEIKAKTTRPHDLWRPDFTYLKVIGWRSLITILDDYRRSIIAWTHCTTLRAEDVTETLDLAVQASGCDQAAVLHKPRLRSETGPRYISDELADWLDDQQVAHVSDEPQPPKISRQDPSRDIAGQCPARLGSVGTRP